MQTYKITYFAPYTFANFTCKAATLEDARAQRDKFNDENGFCIESREVRTETFAGKRV